MLKEQRTVIELREFLDKIYNKVGGEQEELDSLTDDEILVLSGNLRAGVPLQLQYLMVLKNPNQRLT
jgi:DNA-directed RNA polymerase subunit beta